MATKRKVIPRQAKTVVPKHKAVVVPRWNVLSQSGNSVVMDVAGFRDASGRIDMQKVHEAGKVWAGRSMTFAEKREGVTEYRGKTAFDIRQEEKAAPPKPPEPAKAKDGSKRRADRAKSAVKTQTRKTDSSISHLKRVIKSIQKVPKTKTKIVGGQKKRVPVKTVYAKTGTTWNQKAPLKPYQYIDYNKEVRSTSLKRAAEWRAAQQRRLQKAIDRPKMERAARAAARERQKQAKVLAKQRAAQAKHVRAVRDASRKAWARELVRDARHAAFRGALSKAKGYGKKPLGILLAKDRAAGDRGKGFAKMAGRRGVLPTIPRAERYPTMGHGGPAPLKAPVSMRGVSGRLPFGKSVGFDPGAPSRFSTGGTFFSTTKTLKTDKFPAGGRGIVFMIDAQTVLQNLTVRYPQILRETAVAMADGMGRKLLDIVEPYVPKDTGLLYSTAQSNALQMSEGGMGLAGAAFSPSETYGVTISYNAPYAEVVYFNDDPDVAAHGKDYNAKHGVGIKGEEETARWIEVAFEKESAAIQSMYGEYATAVTAALERAGFSHRSFGQGAKARSFWSL